MGCDLCYLELPACIGPWLPWGPQCCPHHEKLKDTWCPPPGGAPPLQVLDLLLKGEPQLRQRHLSCLLAVPRAHTPTLGLSLCSRCQEAQAQRLLEGLKGCAMPTLSLGLVLASLQSRIFATCPSTPTKHLCCPWFGQCQLHR